jgi:hypothetical protein
VPVKRYKMKGFITIPSFLYAFHLLNRAAGYGMIPLLKGRAGYERAIEKPDRETDAHL